MATFRIFEDRENRPAAVLQKDTANGQRKALGILNQAGNNNQKTVKPAVTVNDKLIREKENQFSRVESKNAKSIQPPVAQFEAFSVYEESAESEANSQGDLCKEPSKRDTLKTYAAKKHANERVPLQEKAKEVSPGEKSSILDMSIDRSGSQNDSLLDDGEKATAKTPKDLFFHVAEYREDIYNYMRTIEARQRAHPSYMRKQPDISAAMRAILVDWLVEVGEEYRLQGETLHLAVGYVDRFLSFMSVVRSKLQLVGTAAMFIAAKYEEIYPPDVGEFVYITDDTYNKKQVLRMEQLMLKVLSFDLSAPTPLAFASHFCIANQLSQRTLSLAAYLCELTLLEAEPYLRFNASTVGASGVALARHCLLCGRCARGEGGEGGAAGEAACLEAAWPQGLRAASGYSHGQLRQCLRLLQRSHANAHTQPHRAVPDKYKLPRYDGVANIEPKAIFKEVESSDPDVEEADVDGKDDNAKNDQNIVNTAR